jgi:hypothetical protein
MNFILLYFQSIEGHTISIERHSTNTPWEQYCSWRRFQSKLLMEAPSISIKPRVISLWRRFQFHFILILIHIIRGLEGMSGVRSLVTFKRCLDWVVFYRSTPRHHVCWLVHISHTSIELSLGRSTPGYVFKVSVRNGRSPVSTEVYSWSPWRRTWINTFNCT